VTTHFGMPRSIPAHSQYLSSLFNWNGRGVKLLDVAARSSAKVAELSFVLEVLKMYPLFPLYSHLRNGSRNMVKIYGLNVSPCMILLCICIGCVLPKCSLVSVVVDCEYILPTRATASCG
jgi:hypothetical protein